MALFSNRCWLCAAGVSLLSVVPASSMPGPGTPEPTLARPAHASIVDAGDDEYRYLAGLLDKELYEMAVKEGLAFLRAHPNHPKFGLARYRLATALFELGRRDEATPHYAALVALPAFDYAAEASFRLGQCHLAAGAIGKARSRFADVLTLDQDYLHGPALFFRAESEFRLGEHGAAEASYTALLEDHPQSEYTAPALRGLVWCAWERRDVATTIERARRALGERQGEEGAEIALLLGEALLEGDQHAEALATFTAIESSKLADARLRGIGFACIAAGDPAAAADAFRELLRDHGSSRHASEARLQLGIAEMRSGDSAAAVRTLQNLVGASAGASRDREQDPEALYWFAEALAEDGQPQQAVGILERARALELPEELATRIGVALGEALSSLGRTEEALEAYQAAGSDYALYAAAVAGWNEQDPNRAVQLIRELQRKHPSSSYSSQANHVLGEALLALERYDEAEAAFSAVLTAEVGEELVAQSLNRIAWCRYRSEDLAGSIACFEELLTRFPRQEVAEEAAALLTHVLLEAGRKEEARARGAQYLKQHAGSERYAQVLLVTARASEGQAAIDRLAELTSQYPESPLAPRAQFELGEAQSAARDYDAAAEAYALLLQRYPNDEVVPEAGYALGWCLLQLERFEESAQRLEWVGARRDLQPELALATWELAVWAWSRAQDPERATAAWRKYASRTQDDARRFQSARSVVAAWRDAGRPGEGQGVLDELLRLVQDPEVSVGVLLEGAYLALEEGDVDRAEAQVQVARKRSGETAEVAEASFFVGQARFEGGRQDRAVALYRTAAAEGSPVRAEASYRLGFALLAAGDSVGAAAAFGTVVDEHPEDALWGESLFLRGEALYRNDLLEEAVQEFERVRAETPRHEVLPRALFRLGLALGRLERWARCEEVLNELARRAPDFANLSEAELWRGRSLAAQRKRRAARQAFERVIELDRGELAAQSRIALGRLHEEEGRTDEALSEYLKVALLYAHDEEVAEALVRAGLCLEAMGDSNKALAQYREVLTSHPDARFASEARAAVERLR